MLTIKYHNSFKRGYRKCIKRGCDPGLIIKAISILANGQTLPPEYQDHWLHGKYEGFRECHIQSDWLLIYQINNDELILTLSKTGTHSDLF